MGNPRYTGHEVWNKQRKQESLIDVDDVALGHHTRLTWNRKADWVYSDQPVHDAIVTKVTFEQVQARFASRSPRSPRAAVRRTHPYAFKGLVIHETCGRKMQGNWFHGTAFYRCRYPREYAIANQLEHPTNVFLKEDTLIGPLDTWLAEVFAPENVEQTLTRLEAAQPDYAEASEPLRRAIAECDRKLARHRAALEAGADPVMVAAWSSDIYRDRAALTTQLATKTNHTHALRMSRAEINQLVDMLGGLLAVLRAADPRDKFEVYRELGLKLAYNHTTGEIMAEANPRPQVGVLSVSGGGLEPPRPIKGTSTSS